MSSHCHLPDHCHPHRDHCHHHHLHLSHHCHPSHHHHCHTSHHCHPHRDHCHSSHHCHPSHHCHSSHHCHPSLHCHLRDLCHFRDLCHLRDHCHPSHHCHSSHHCHPSHHCHLHNWRHISRQMRMLDLRLQLLRDRLCAARLHRLSLPCCCSHHHGYHGCHGFGCHGFRCPRRALIARAKRLGMLLSSSCCHLPCDVKCFDPHDVCVSVNDGKVTVHAEHKDECDTGLSKSCSYRRFTKEFSLPPGEEEVTYSEESNSVTKIEPNCCSHHCDC